MDERRRVFIVFLVWGFLTELGVSDRNNSFPSSVPSFNSCNCVHVTLCKSLYSLLLKRPLTTKVIDYLKNKTCGYFGREPYVCCDRARYNSRFGPVREDENLKEKNDDLTERNEISPRGDFFPDDDCGLSVDERIVGGSDVGLGTYPWMARVGYALEELDKGEYLFRCGGSLITDRDVITAAHCVVDLPTGLVLAIVRLGELDERSDPDCRDGECADRPQDFKPLLVVVHSDYGFPRYRNDIALIKLNRIIEKTPFVRPICLACGLAGFDEITGSSAVTAGWGIVNSDSGARSPILRHVRLFVWDGRSCSAVYANKFGLDVDSSGQICAGAGSSVAPNENMADACAGDSGGPLMRTRIVDGLPRRILVGIVSFGPTRCGNIDVPGVFTKISHYVPWILKHL